MNYSSEAAEQVVRMSLNGVEIAAKISGKAAERLALLLYAVLRDQKKTKGKIRLTNMIKSGKELKVFAVRDEVLQTFCQEAKKYGVLYCVLKDTKAEDGLTDIMVRAEDASKINRIFERFGLADMEVGSVKTEYPQRDAPEAAAEKTDAPASRSENLERFLNTVTGGKKEQTKEEQQPENPTMARITKSPQSGPLLRSRKDRSLEDTDELESRSFRRSVREELKEIERQRQNADIGIKPEVVKPDVGREVR